jgi:hypothetical protein
MPTFSELVEAQKDDWKQTTGGSSLLNSYADDEPALDVVTRFFENHGFHNLEFLGSGSSAIVLKDLDNPALVFRIAPTYALDTRAVIPQVLQPLHVERVGRLKIEVLPNVSIPDEMPDEQFDQLLAQFKKEVRASGHSVDSDHPQADVGLLRYEDTKRPGTFREAFVAADASLVPPVEGAIPTCGSDYPTLQDQWREQNRLIAADPRLQQLVGVEAKKFPTTKVQRDDRPLS